MDISGDYVFDAPQALVWQALQDPNVLGSIMPGGQGFEQTGENQYNGVLQVKVGPVQGNFQGQVKLSDLKPPESYQIVVDGKGAPGFVRASGGLQLEARDGQTVMKYSGQAQVGGRIASVGQRLLDSSARSIIRQSLDALNEYLKVEMAQQAQQAQQAPQAGPSQPAQQPLQPQQATAPVSAATTQTASAVTYKPPSQTALALNVARDVLGDIIPAKYQPVLVGTALVVIILIIMLLILR